MPPASPIVQDAIAACASGTCHALTQTDATTAVTRSGGLSFWHKGRFHPLMVQLTTATATRLVYYHTSDDTNYLDGAGNVRVYQFLLPALRSFDDDVSSAHVKLSVSKPFTASAAGNHYLWQGREWDSESGSYQYRHRVYCAAIPIPSSCSGHQPS